MKISVIVRTYNRPDLLKEALVSVQLQSHTDWEVIIFDDSASDVNFNIYKDFKSQNPNNDVIYHTSNTPYNLFKNSWKLGAKLANGELIVRLDDDDLLAEDALEYLSNTYTHHIDLDFSYGSAVFFENTTLQQINQTQTPLEAPKTRDLWTAYTIPNNHPWTQPWSWTSNFYDEPQHYTSIIHCSKANIMCIYHTYVMRTSALLKVIDKFEITSNFVDDLEVMGSLDYLGLAHTSIKRILTYARVHNEGRVTDTGLKVNGTDLWNDIFLIRDKVDYLRTEGFQSNIYPNQLEGNFNEGRLTSTHQHYFSNYIFRIKQIANKFGKSK